MSTSPSANIRRIFDTPLKQYLGEKPRRFAKYDDGKRGKYIQVKDKES
jgi:hypothetical protein